MNGNFTSSARHKAADSLVGTRSFEEATFMMQKSLCAARRRTAAPLPHALLVAPRENVTFSPSTPISVTKAPLLLAEDLLPVRP